MTHARDTPQTRVAAGLAAHPPAVPTRLLALPAQPLPGLFVEIEAADRDDPTGEKARRKAFYLRNGLQDMHVVANLFGVRMELLGRGCDLDFDSYRAFYHDHYNAWAAEHVVRPEED